MHKMEKMRPWLIMLQLSVTQMRRLGYSPELGIDQHFLSIAKNQKKPVIELETAVQQMSLLAKEDKAFQDRLLYYTLESMQELEPMLDEMFEAWKKGDVKSFEKILDMPLKDDPTLEESTVNLSPSEITR